MARPKPQVKSTESKRSHQCAALLLCAGLTLAPVVQAEDKSLWELGVGVGVLSTPHYRGSETRENYALPFPYGIYRGSFLKVDRENGIRGKLFKGKDVHFDLSLAGNVPVPDSDEGARSGMDGLDLLIEVGAEMKIGLWRSLDGNHRFGFNVPLRAVYSVGDPLLEYQGLTLSPYLNYRIRQPSEAAVVRYSVSAGPIFATSRYHDYFYEVDSEFVTPEREEYHGNSGYSGSRVTVSATRHFDDFVIGAFARYDYLGGAVFEDSPLVETDDYLVVGVVFGWILGKSESRSDH
jgi:outer membrane protein